MFFFKQQILSHAMDCVSKVFMHQPSVLSLVLPKLIFVMASQINLLRELHHYLFM